MKEIFFLLLFLMYLNVRMEIREMFNCMHYSFFFCFDCFVHAGVLIMLFPSMRFLRLPRNHLR